MTHTIGAFEGLTGSTPGVPCVAGNRLSMTDSIGRFEGLTGSTPRSALRCRLSEGRSPIISAPVTSLAGDFLRATRERQGVSQEELARRVGSHQPQVSAWETGRKPIQVEQLAALLEALGLELRLGAEPKRGE